MHILSRVSGIVLRTGRMRSSFLRYAAKLSGRCTIGSIYGHPCRAVDSARVIEHGLLSLPACTTGLIRRSPKAREIKYEAARPQTPLMGLFRADSHLEATL
jgi:hypothetical protein